MTTTFLCISLHDVFCNVYFGRVRMKTPLSYSFIQSFTHPFTGSGFGKKEEIQTESVSGQWYHNISQIVLQLGRRFSVELKRRTISQILFHDVVQDFWATNFRRNFFYVCYGCCCCCYYGYIVSAYLLLLKCTASSSPFESFVARCFRKLIFC